MKQTIKTAGKLLGDSALLLALAVSPAALAQGEEQSADDWQLKREQFQEQLRQNAQERKTLIEQQRQARRQALEDNPDLAARLEEQRRERIQQQRREQFMERNPRQALGVDRGPRHLPNLNKRQMQLRFDLPNVRQLPGQRPFRRG